MSIVHSDKIPNYIAAGTPMGLRRLMILKNAKLGGMVEYFNIQYAEINGKKMWVAWYYETIDDSQINELSSNQ
jgi:hypothetical protein